MEAPKMSPWGKVQESKVYSDDAVRVHTPSHGGVLISPMMNEKIPEAFRIKEGWYEEDCDWAIPYYFIPEVFGHVAVKLHDDAKKTLKIWHWRQWDKMFKLDQVDPNESSQKMKVIMEKRSIGKMKVLSVLGDWHEKTPKGFVRVCASKILSPESYGPEESYFLIPEKEYQNVAKKFFIFGEKDYRNVA